MEQQERHRDQAVDIENPHLPDVGTTVPTIGEPATPPDEGEEADERGDDTGAQHRDARFGFRFDDRYRWAAWPFGVRPGTTSVEVRRTSDPPELWIRFGPWCVRTPLDNVAGVDVTGPYSLLKTIGPPRVSFVDTGLTFATNAEAGVCIHFEESVGGLDPAHLVRHPGVTVTVADPDALADELRASPRHAVVA